MSKLPHNIDAEQQVLGALLLRDDVFHDLPEELSADDFFEPSHQAIFRTCATLMAAGRRVTTTTVQDYLSTDKVKIDPDYLDNLTDAVADVHDAPLYARQVYELAHRRRSIIAMQDGISQLMRLDPRENSLSVISEIEAKVLSANRSEGQTTRRIGEWAMMSAARIEKIVQEGDPAAGGFSWGLTSVDNVIGPALPGSLIVLGGRSGMGKSALAGQCAVAMAEQCLNMSQQTGKSAAIGAISLEMQGEMWADRILAARVKRAAWKITRGKLDYDEVDAVMQAACDLRSLPLYIDQKTRVTIDQIRARALRWKHQYGLKGLFVDHLGLIRPVSKRSSPLEHFDDVCQELKSLAKELGIFVVLLCQVNKDSRGRDNDRPRASDLMYYSAIEPHADIIFFPYRAYVAHMERKPDPKNMQKMDEWEHKAKDLEDRAEIINAKARSGKGHGSCECRFIGPLMKFEDLQSAGTKLAQSELDMY